ncbi:hypothetical protein JEQ12_019271 [Ovis aries]|uniref:Uncharacterized protein n=1 Tax=Ovis aries TaxID=9940 RepID=A0A836D2P5_SHEEP|nr:hypothetical protein JEQ12_019271 [Ovis aries]
MEQRWAQACSGYYLSRCQASSPEPGLSRGPGQHHVRAKTCLAHSPPSLPGTNSLAPAQGTMASVPSAGCLLARNQYYRKASVSSGTSLTSPDSANFVGDDKAQLDNAKGASAERFLILLANIFQRLQPTEISLEQKFIDSYTRFSFKDTIGIQCGSRPSMLGWARATPMRQGVNEAFTPGSETEFDRKDILTEECPIAIPSKYSNQERREPLEKHNQDQLDTDAAEMKVLSEDACVSGQLTAEREQVIAAAGVGKFKDSLSRTELTYERALLDSMKSVKHLIVGVAKMDSLEPLDIETQEFAQKSESNTGSESKIPSQNPTEKTDGDFDTASVPISS